MAAPLEKFDFASVAWVAAVRTCVEGLLSDQDLTGIDFTMSEEFTDPPYGRSLTSAGTLGWYLRIRDNAIDLGNHPLDEADVRVVADYRTPRDLSRRTWAGNSEAMATAKVLREQAVAEGRLRIAGDLSTAPRLIRDLGSRASRSRRSTYQIGSPHLGFSRREDSGDESA
jgi:hypothetical protein